MSARSTDETRSTLIDLTTTETIDSTSIPSIDPEIGQVYRSNLFNSVLMIYAFTITPTGFTLGTV